MNQPSDLYLRCRCGLQRKLLILMRSELQSRDLCDTNYKRTTFLPNQIKFRDQIFDSNFSFDFFRFIRSELIIAVNIERGKIMITYEFKLGNEKD